MSVSREKQFVDTNILVYAHDISAGTRHVKAKALLTELWNSGNGCLSIQVLQEFYVTITQKVSRPLAPETAASIIRDLACWQVHTPKPPDVLEAIEIQMRHKVSFWDAMILRSAQALDCSTLWSEDLNPGQHYGAIRVLNPFLE
ncbi:PIN domain-containing protein [Neomoorella mulderi]|uniref:tRNA(FMet)-specific endonuclease VapC n=1 Tax=Moorella mulderi DSM 14980 TaxID=1122241 RepID=A0A151AVL8_9FIRM|nr:PIN domain-containing protein [Moorella mulderi]KYH31696.1 tRNA(fMet)-specific endonuclease VapC [Moorella mulderi DSM 14980]